MATHNSCRTCLSFVELYFVAQILSSNTVCFIYNYSCIFNHSVNLIIEASEEQQKLYLEGITTRVGKIHVLSKHVFSELFLGSLQNVYQISHAVPRQAICALHIGLPQAFPLLTLINCVIINLCYAVVRRLFSAYACGSEKFSAFFPPQRFHAFI